MNSKYNPQTFLIMEKQVIVAEMVQSNQSNNQVWHVHVTNTDNPELQGYCKTAFSAMRLAFIIKQRSGFYISDSTLQLLMQLHRMKKQPAKEDTEETTEPTPVEEDKPKRKTRRAKKEKAAA